MRPTLVIMAAGMGSRFGGSKQITAVDAYGHAIMEFSIYDALRAGFGKVVIIIKHSFEEEFRRAIGDRIASYCEVEYAYQEIDKLPDGFEVPEGRVKPWGTAHAVLCAKDLIPGDFCAINADDLYGAGAFAEAAKFFERSHDPAEHAMVAYNIENTLSENGSVSRGVCSIRGGLLTGIIERTKIYPMEGGAKFMLDDDKYEFLPNGTPVSMNFWCFKHSILDEIQTRFSDFLSENIEKNPLKCEYYLPLVPNLCIAEGKAKVRVLPCDEKWYGITYKEDMDELTSAIAKMESAGRYPADFGERS